MTSLNPSAPSWSLYSERQRWGFLAILFLVSTSSYLDRTIISVLLEPIKQEFQVSDTMLGLLGGFCFSIFYALFGLPVARWADRGNRRTIITLALTVWSAMTVICGFAQSFAQLALARIGVGAGESGAIPPAQSLVADYFPPERRAGALAIFTSASTAGYFLGFGIGGYIAATHGWRMALIVAGAPGLILALFTHFKLDEPRRRLMGIATGADGERTREMFARLRAKTSFVFAFVGCISYFYVAYGAIIFIPSFMIRSLKMPLEHVGVTYGTAMALGSFLGTLAGGWLGNRYGNRDVRWLAWLPAIACALAGPMYAIAFSLNGPGVFLVVSVAAGTLVSAGMPSIYAAIHAVCGSRRRATAIAIVLFAATLVGGGFGPLVTGALSDALAASYGAEALRHSLRITMVVMLLSAACFYCCGRRIHQDLED